jgi:hypothetical protein
VSREEIKGAVGDVVRWASVIMLIVDFVNTHGGWKWRCLVLDAGPDWIGSNRPGSLVHYRNIDFTEKLTSGQYEP